MSELPRMTCEEAEPLLPLVADGALEPDDDPALFDHLASCAACQESLARHDLITLAVGQGKTPEPVRKPIQFVRMSWAMAAAWLLMVGGVGAALWAFNRPALTTTPAMAIQPEVISEQDGRFLIRIGNETFETTAEDGLRDQPDADGANIKRQGSGAHGTGRGDRSNVRVQSSSRRH